jgi:hypothetical protein
MMVKEGKKGNAEQTTGVDSKRAIAYLKRQTGDG